METIKLETHIGDNFGSVATKAQGMASTFTEHNASGIVEFDFNGVQVMVDKDTDLEHLTRDYHNAHLMEWQKIGPKCDAEYSEQTVKAILDKQAALDAKHEESRKERQVVESAQEAFVKGATGGIEFQVVPGKEAEYEEYKTKNGNDGYSNAVVQYAESLGKLLQGRMESSGSTIEETIVRDLKTSEAALDYIGITGFQYGCVMQQLSHFWIHGKAMRRHHNKQYGHEEETEGVINPAVFSVKA